VARWTLTACVLLVLARSARSVELFVDQKHAQANDKNPGTEALPFKTIPAAVERAQPGDTIWVKAGDYEERVVLNKPATAARPIVLSAWKDDRVRIGYQPRPLPVQGEWQPIPGSKCWQIRLTQDVPDDFLVLLDGKAILTWPQDGPPKDEKVNWASYRRSERTLMFNANGRNPGQLGQFAYGRRPHQLTFMTIEPPAAWWIVRRLEFSWIGVGVYLCGDNCVVEDCFFTHCYRGGMFIHGRTDIVRRCNFYRCGNGMHASGAGVGHILEDNLIVECSLRAEDDILPLDIPGCQPEGYGPTCFKGNMLAMTFIHNIVSDNPGAGWYADCPGVQSSRVIGNAFWDNRGGGIYNEAMVNDSLTQGNVFYRNGIGSSVATRWNLVDNLFHEGGIFWNNLDINPMRDGYMLLRRNAFINVPQGYLCGYASGWAQYAWPEVFRDCIVDRNRIWLPEDGVLINDGGAKKYRTLDEVRKEFQWELHGQVLPYDKDRDTVESVAKAMGGSVVTFRIPWGKHSADARPMLANAQVNTPWPGAVLSTDTGSMPCYFWRVADGNYVPPIPGDWARFIYHEYWLTGGGGENSGETHGCRWYCDADAKFPADLEEKTPCRKGHLQEWCWKMAYTEGNFWLVTEGLNPDKMLPQGVGYWTPFLGAAPGARTTVSLRMRGQDLVSTDKGSPAVWLQFTNETGQHRQRVFLIGKDDRGKLQRPQLTQGSYGWTEVRQEITAPEDAVRMALFFGLTPCKGRVNFDDIQITTASEAAASLAGILPPRLPLPKIKDTVLVDISKQANRALADETDNDGKGGWTDQGAAANMRALKTGDRRLGGVMFRLLDGPSSIIVLKSPNRAKGALPERVTIPVGRKLDTLFFLHAAAWCPTGAQEAFRYVIQYAGGK